MKSYTNNSKTYSKKELRASVNKLMNSRAVRDKIIQKLEFNIVRVV